MAGLNSLLKRQASDTSSTSGSSSASTAAPNCSGSNSSGPQCQKPADATNVTIPVAVAVIVPLFAAVFVFIYLHRKHVKKLRQEDANDPHKSLDFGLDSNAPATLKSRNKNGKKTPEMTITDMGEKGSRRERGLSMDLDIGSPYPLPPGLDGSRESLHSMSRTIHSDDDRYRPATNWNPGDRRSLHSYRTGRKVGDDSSSDAGSMKKDLLGNAQRMSRSMPPTSRSPVPQIQEPEAAMEIPHKAVPSTPTGLTPKFPLLDSRDSYMTDSGADLRKSNNYLGAFIHSREPSSDLPGEKSEYVTPNEFPATPTSNMQQTSDRKSPPPTTSIAQELPTANTYEAASRPSRLQPLHASEQGNFGTFMDDPSEHGHGFKVTPPSPHGSQPEQHDLNRRSSQAYMPPIDEHLLGVNDRGFGYEPQRLSMGFVPLPPEDPTDNPEQRANRIRSFYKEYFDDSKPAPAGAADYYEDYDQQYLGDGAIYDESSGQYVNAYPHEPRGRPFAQPVGRRAMTPPPRAPQPRFARQHATTLSGGGRMMLPGPRAFSSASGRFGPSGHGPKKPLPPPSPLQVLPTPHMLKDDSFAIFNSMDFAPPTSAKERVLNRPESPRGGLRPYSPAVPAHVPLASSFDEIAAMPSPHLLRKSGTFTALDFAPPPRFKNSDTASDAGSIRSNRSAMSASAAHSIRAGAYRVSRIPKQVVGTKGDIMESLKPKWDLNR